MSIWLDLCCIQMFDMCSASSSGRCASCEAWHFCWSCYSMICRRETRACCPRSVRSRSTFEMSTDSSSRACRHLWWWGWKNLNFGQVYYFFLHCLNIYSPTFIQVNRTEKLVHAEISYLTSFLLKLKIIIMFLFFYLFIFRNKIEFKVKI